MRDYFQSLYGCYCELLKTLFNKKSKFIKTIIYYDIGFQLTEIDYHIYFTKNYKKAKRSISKALKESPETIFKFAEIRCDYLLKRKNEAFSKFKIILKDYKQGLIPISQIIDEFNSMDNRILLYIKGITHELEYSQLLSEIQRHNEIEHKRKTNFMNTSQQIKRHFEINK